MEGGLITPQLLYRTKKTWYLEYKWLDGPWG